MIRGNQPELRFIDWNQVRYSLEWIYEGSPPATGTQKINHHLPGLSAWLVRKGHVSITGKNKTITAEQGEWVFPPFEHDEREFSKDAEILSIRFRASWGGDNELFRESVPHKCSSSAFPQLARSAERLFKSTGHDLSSHKNEMMFRHVSLDRHVKTYYSFIAWVAEYIKVMRKIGVIPHQVVIIDDRVRKAKEYLDTVSFRANFKESDVAEHVGISVAQLNRLFVRDIGISPAAYMKNRKLDYAKQMLIDSNIPIKQIGFELGFNDAANFTNWFRTPTRMTPKRFRSTAMSTGE